MMPATSAFTELVWTQLWQVTLLAAAITLLAMSICRRRPRLAYLLGLVVLVKCWVPPLWSSRLGVFCWPTVSNDTSVLAPSTEEAPATSLLLHDEDPVPANAEPTAAATIAPAVVKQPPRRKLSPAGSTTPWPFVLGSVWLGGALALSFMGWYQARRWRKRLARQASATDSDLDTLSADIARRLGLRRQPTIVITSAAVGPAVFGIFRPTIVLPESLVASADRARLQMVLAHELTHIRRGDLAVGTFQWLTQIIWWFHPLIWVTCRQVTREREHSCDEDVLALLHCPPVAYAQCLLDVLRFNRRAPWLPAFSGMRAVDVTRRRFEHILRDGKTSGRTPVSYWLLAIVVLCLTLPGARWVSATPTKQLAAQERSQVQFLAESPRSRDPEPPRSEPGEAEKEGTVLAVADVAPGQAEENKVKQPPPLEKAILAAVAFLRAEQQEDGHWPDPVGYPGGISSLCTLALQRSGVKPDDPTVSAALAYLRKLKPQRTYSTSLQTMVLCAAGQLRDLKLIQRNVDWLCAQQKQAGPMTGAWAYPEAEGDNSNTSFAMMALYEADKVGVKAPAAVWRAALNYWVNCQNPNGSWGYKPQTGGTGSMTSQGLFSVSAATKLLGEQKPEQPGPKAIDRATTWLGRQFIADGNPGSRGAQGWMFYYLHGVAQAGQVSGLEKFGEHDWFVEGAKHLLDLQQTDGSWRGTGHAEDDPHVATAFAILFLSQRISHEN